MHICPGCGAPTAPSWAHCPKCATTLGDPAVPAPQSNRPEPDELPTTSTGGWGSARAHRPAINASLLLAVIIVAAISANDVVAHNQLKSARAALTSARTQVSGDSLSLRVVNARLHATVSQEAINQASMLDHQTTLQNEVQGVIDLLKGTTTNGDASVTTVATVRGVTATLVFEWPHSADVSSISLATVVSGASSGHTYAIAWGPCPEDPSTLTFAASAPVGQGGSVILPTINIGLTYGIRYWFRLHEIAPPGTSGVLGGILDPLIRQGTTTGEGTPVSGSGPAC